MHSLKKEFKSFNALHPELTKPADQIGPARLFQSSSPKKTRISVISLKGLATPAGRQSFVADLVSKIFETIYRPESELDGSGKPSLKGLLVNDEAKDYVPSQSGAFSKSVIIRFSEQARKYGYGLVLASQEFKSVDYQVISNCGTMLVGRQPAPVSGENVKKYMGSPAADVDFAALPPGRFIMRNRSFGDNKPVLVNTAMSLSLHGPPPPDAELLRIAAESKAKA